MRFCAWGLVLSLAATALGSGPVIAQNSKAFETCAVTALQQAMLVRSVVAQSALRDSRGKVVGTKLDLAVNALGKKRTVSCYFTEATRTAVIREYRPGSGGPGGMDQIAQQRREALRACQAAAKQQRLMLDRVVSESDVFNRRGDITGRDIIMNVYRAGTPSQLLCEYDYASRRTLLELRRAMTR